MHNTQQANYTVPEGWRLVPVEPTESMIEAARDVKRQRLLKAVNEAKTGKQPDTIGMAMACGEEWSAMLSAAPQPAAAPQPVAMVDYTALLQAAEARKYKQGSGACIAFKHGAEWQAARAPALAAAPAGVAREPVAWSPDLTYPGYSQTRVWANGAPHQKDIDYWRKEGYGITLAYTAPPARQALTDERIRSIHGEETGFDIDSSPVALMDFARAIERTCAADWGVTLVGIGGKGGANG